MRHRKRKLPMKTILKLWNSVPMIGVIVIICLSTVSQKASGSEVLSNHHDSLLNNTKRKIKHNIQSDLPLWKTQTLNKQHSIQPPILNHNRWGLSDHRKLLNRQQHQRNMLYFDDDSVFGDIRKDNDRTLQPTKSPTATPSSQPTFSPTTQPSLSMAPTTLPSSYPSIHPTDYPTSTPTGLPTTIPTSTPTALPTTIPTHQPTHRPSELPTHSPSDLPSSTPTTALPTTTPSIGPSNVPSTAPSMQPTVYPTTVPTEIPSNQPTIAPSHLPSTLPSAQPTLDPSAEPTFQPSSTPSSYPTNSPIVSPTLGPTSMPSDLPSIQPSQEPTNIPTWIPSDMPTIHPSIAPSHKPSIKPSMNPTIEPTYKPSNIPSQLPTQRPTHVPSIAPSRQPTSTPTNEPTYVPSNLPTTIPSSEPSNIPSQFPTFLPSSIPSFIPSNIPSRHPTSEPSWFPSNVPTFLPSNHPIVMASVSPSDVPSMVPSPSPSSLPSSSPSVIPSSVPSFLPTITPTEIHSEPPTQLPSSSPSFSPTQVPSTIYDYETFSLKRILSITVATPNSVSLSRYSKYASSQQDEYSDLLFKMNENHVNDHVMNSLQYELSTSEAQVSLKLLLHRLDLEEVGSLDFQSANNDRSRILKNEHRKLSETLVYTTFDYSVSAQIVSLPNITEGSNIDKKQEEYSQLLTKAMRTSFQQKDRIKYLLELQSSSKFDLVQVQDVSSLILDPDMVNSNNNDGNSNNNNIDDNEESLNRVSSIQKVTIRDDVSQYGYWHRMTNSHHSVTTVFTFMVTIILGLASIVLTSRVLYCEKQYNNSDNDSSRYSNDSLPESPRLPSHDISFDRKSESIDNGEDESSLSTCSSLWDSPSQQHDLIYFKKNAGNQPKRPPPQPSIPEHSTIGT